jgi:hypothetical protein
MTSPFLTWSVSGQLHVPADLTHWMRLRAGPDSRTLYHQLLAMRIEKSLTENDTLGHCSLSAQLSVLELLEKTEFCHEKETIELSERNIMTGNNKKNVYNSLICHRKISK